MRRIREDVKRGGAKFTQAALAGVLAVGLMPLPAFAAGLQPAATDFSAQAEAMDPSGQVIAAAYAAANPAPEILGLNNPNQRSANEAEQTYNFFGDPDINESVDPYLYNTHNSLTPAVTIGGRQGSPMSRLNAYDAEATEPPAQNAVWEQLPHIILGTGNDTIPENEHDFYASDARVVETALGLEANSYNPIGVTYNRVTLPTMIQTMYRLAAAADEVTAADSSLKTRYEDPMDIARNYERYIVGQKGVVKRAIDSGAVKQKTIALVQSYDSDAHTYTIITDGVAEGTATTNRYLEAVQGVSNNYYDTVGESGSTEVTADMLKENVDVIILGGQASTESGTLYDYLAKDGLGDRTFYCVNWANGSAFGTTVNSVENAQNVGRILPCVYPELLDQSDMIAYYYDAIYHLKDGSIPTLIDERMDGVRNWEKTDSASYTDWAAADVSDYNRENVEALLKSGVAYLLTQAGLPEYLTPTDQLAGDQGSVATIEVPTAVTGLVYTGKELVGVEAAPQYSVEGGSATAVGSYTATVTPNAGYVWADGTSAAKKVEWAIEASGKVAVPTAKTGLVYTGKEQTGVAAGANYTVKNGTATNAGTYEATVTPNAGYSWSDGTTAAKKVSFTIAKAPSTVKLAAQSKKYTGKALAYDGTATKTGSTGAVTYKYYSDAKATKEVKAADVKNAGTYYVVGAVAADTNYAAATSAAVKLKVTKIANTLKVKAVKATQTVKYNKKKAQTIKAAKAFKATKNVSKGALTYKKTSGNKNITVAKNGKITIKKGTKKNTYTIKVKVTSKATTNYKAANATVTLKVKVK